MKDLLKLVTKCGLDMNGPDHLWYSGESQNPSIRGRPRGRPISRNEAAYAVALSQLTNLRNVARWLRRDDAALRRAVHRHKGTLTS